MKKKGAIVYFSVYGSTEKLAKEIAGKTGYDLIRIKPLIPYDSDKKNYERLVALGKIERQDNKRPMINDINIKKYDVIFLGYPIWWETFPMAVYSFLEKNNLSSKIVVPFATHEGSKEANTFNDLEKMYPKAKILKGFETRGSQVIYDKSEIIEDWLREIKII